jgi:hypothetical protein
MVVLHKHTKKMASIHTIVRTILLEDYSLIVERSACPSDPESYAGGSISSWQSPMPERSKGRGPDKVQSLVFQVGGLVWG